jgi:hypothetical protein
MIGELTAWLAGALTAVALLAGGFGMFGDRDVVSTLAAAAAGCVVFVAACWVADKVIGHE